jgi:hypothetical protein
MADPTFAIRNRLISRSEHFFWLSVWNLADQYLLG